MRALSYVIVVLCLFRLPSTLRAQQSTTQASQGETTIVVPGDAVGKLPSVVKDRIIRQVEQSDRSLLLFLSGVPSRDLSLVNLTGPSEQVRGNRRDRMFCRDCDDSGLEEHDVYAVLRGGFGPPLSAFPNPALRPPQKFDGHGVTIALVDIGAIYSDHVEFLTTSATGSQSRVSPATPRELADAHATADAGTAAAAGVFPRAKGAAPGTSIIGVHNTVPAKYWEDVEAIVDRALISSHSTVTPAGWDDQNWWGVVGQARDPVFGSYGAAAFSADDITKRHPSHLMFIAAGNDRDDGQPDYVQPIDHNHQVMRDGQLRWVRSDTDVHRRDGDDGYQTVVGACVAKNVVCVGAVFDLDSMARAEVTDFSNFGPTLDGRIKPDVVANGYDVLSLSTSPTALYDERSSGTSQATPLTAGIAALVHEALAVYRMMPIPPASLVKAILLHTARARDTFGPSPSYGWGLPNATAAIELLQNGNNVVEMVTVTRGTPTVVKFRRTSSEPFRVTTVWTDPPALATSHDARTLVNDIDAELTPPAGGTALLPWVLDDTRPFAARRAANHKDNVEIIDVTTGAAQGEWTLTLRPTAFAPTSATQEVAIILPGPKLP